MVTINEIQEARDRAESSTDLREIWKATLDEVRLRWIARGKPDGEPPPSGAIMLVIGGAIVRDERNVALLQIEAWRDVWLNFLRHTDATSNGRLNVIDSLRRARE